MLLTAGLLIIKRGYKVYHHNQPVCFCECVTDCRHMRRPGRLFCVHMGIRRTGSLVSALWTAGQTLYCFILTCCVTRQGSVHLETGAMTQNNTESSWSWTSSSQTQGPVFSACFSPHLPALSVPGTESYSSGATQAINYAMFAGSHWLTVWSEWCIYLTNKCPVPGW